MFGEEERGLARWRRALTHVQIMIVGMALINPIKTLMTVSTYFKSLEEDGVPVDLRLAKAAFVLLNLLGVLLALYKCSTSA